MLWIAIFGLSVLHADLRPLLLNLTYDVAPLQNKLQGTTQISRIDKNDWRSIKEGDMIAPGKYTVRFSYNGYQHAQQDINITSSAKPFIIQKKLLAKYRAVYLFINYDIFPTIEAHSSQLILIDKQIPYLLPEHTQIKPGNYLFSVKQPQYDDTPFSLKILAHDSPDLHKIKLSKTKDIYLHNNKRQIIFHSIIAQQLQVARSILINGKPANYTTTFSIGSQITIEANFAKYGSIKISFTIPEGYGPIVIKLPLQKKSSSISHPLFLKEKDVLKPPYLSTMREALYGHYLYPIQKLQKQEQQYLLSKYKSSFVDTLGISFSYVGNYRKARHYLSSNLKKEKKPQSIDLENYQVLDAAEAICEVARTRNVIFINEAHHIPQHRVLPTILLEKLYKQGFRYFAAEALSQYDQIEKRGYPTFSSDSYIREPIYGNLVRTALKLGYKVVAYEHVGNTQKQRDKGQAQNLYQRIFASDPDAKVLVHAGYGHIYEQKTDIWYPMAKYFKEISGIDPFTIDQTEMTECNKTHLENPYFQWIQKEITPKNAIVLRKEKNTFWVDKKGWYDCQVFQPRSKYSNGRPQWLSLGGKRQPVIIPTKNSISPLLIQAFDVVEQEQQQQTQDLAIPIDQIAIWKKQPQACLYLPKGNFFIRFMDQDGNILKKFTRFIK